jgi:hypothetical protein
MEIIVCDATKLSLYPITIITLLGDKQHRVTAKELLDQYCTDKGLISWDLTNTLGLVASAGNERTFTMVAGTFSTTKFLCLTRAILLYLSKNCTMIIARMIVLQERSANLNYGIILDQDIMQALDLDTSIQDNMISWGENKSLWFHWNDRQQRVFSSRKPASQSSQDLWPKKLPMTKYSSLKHSHLSLTFKQSLNKSLATVQTLTLTSNLVSSKSYETMKPYFLANMEIGRAAPWRLRSWKGPHQFGQFHTWFH